MLLPPHRLSVAPLAPELGIPEITERKKEGGGRGEVEREGGRKARRKGGRKERERKIYLPNRTYDPLIPDA